MQSVDPSKQQQHKPQQPASALPANKPAMPPLLTGAQPLIGVPTFLDTTLPEKMPQRFAMSRPYIAALEAVGALPVLLPLDLNEATMHALFRRLDGLFLAGGGDVNPNCYRKDKHERTDGIDDLRDQAELLYATWALDANMPILGVCRGVQTMSVAAGGTLMQDVPTFVPNAIRHQYYPEFPREYVAHEVETVAGTRLASILGPTAQVNSFHHQAVETLPAGFCASAYAPDGVIEAVERESRDTFAVGVQWHPESLVFTDASMMNLFQQFIAAA